jgi:nicotinic acid phosphoribosyltransferase
MDAADAKPLMDPLLAHRGGWVIESLLDTDLYKFTMMQVVLHHFPGALSSTASSAAPRDRPLTLIEEIRLQVRHLCNCTSSRKSWITSAACAS